VLGAGVRSAEDRARNTSARFGKGGGVSRAPQPTPAGAEHWSRPQSPTAQARTGQLYCAGTPWEAHQPIEVPVFIYCFTTVRLKLEQNELVAVS
jgi:hypothetical protein